MDEPNPYDASPDRYDAWFDEHPAAFDSEIKALETYQTLFSDPDQMADPEPVRPGHGEGGFVVIGAQKPSSPPT